MLETVHKSYDMTRHSRAGSPQAAVLTRDFADEFGIFGPPATVVARLGAIIDAGVTSLTIVGPSWGADPREAERAAQRMVEEVLPALRARP